MENPYGKIILALETALNGGSVSILKNGRQIDWEVGMGELSKSEDILPLIEKLLKKNGVDRREVGLIAVSDGPGSLTGLRIGLATARGLGDSLSAEVYQISVLEAQTYRINLEGRVLSALYTKKGGVFYREFLIKDGQSVPFGEIVQNPEISDFARKLENLNEEIDGVVSDKNLWERLKMESGAIKKNIKIVLPVKANLAETIGLAAFENRVR